MSESSPHEAHRREAAERAKQRSICCAVLTVSDTRTLATDEGGDLVRRLIEESGHGVVARDLVRDEPGQIRSVLEQWIADPQVDVIITTGGTGIARRDTTIGVVRGLLTVELEGFGELFRMISYQRIGSAAMLSRAVGGLVAGSPGADGDTFIFALPGSPNAVRTAMTELVAPQLAHLVWERGR